MLSPQAARNAQQKTDASILEHNDRAGKKSTSLIASLSDTLNPKPYTLNPDFYCTVTLLYHS
jgi:hypothetical protein